MYEPQTKARTIGHDRLLAFTCKLKDCKRLGQPSRRHYLSHPALCRHPEFLVTNILPHPTTYHKPLSTSVTHPSLDYTTDFDEDVYDGAERAAASGAPKTGPVRVKQQWSTPQLASAPAKPGLKPAVSNTLKAEPVSPAPPARPVASAPSRQAMQEDASALEDMLEGEWICNRYQTHVQ